MRTLRVALAQINPVVGDLEGNARHIVERLRQAREIGADVVLFPELAVTGYPPEDLVLKPDFVEGNLRAVEEIAAHAVDLVAVVGFVDRATYLYNAAAVCAGGRVAGVYHKRLLPNYGVFDEKRYFAPGESVPVFRLGDLPIAVNICEDIWFPDGPLAVQAQAGALVAFNINGSPYHRGKWREREEMLRTRARDHGVVLCYVNVVGGQDELVFDGGSVVVDQEGRVLARGPQFEEALVVCDVDVARARRLRARRTGVEESDRFPLQAPPVSVIELEGLRDRPRPPAEPLLAEPLPDLEEVYRALVVGTRDYVRKNGFHRVVVGLSGGIDSSLVAVIATDALGPENVWGVSMPSPYTSEESMRYAEELARNLGIRLLVLPIGEIFRSYLEALAGPFAGTRPNEAEENIQARIRGNLLMALTNKFGGIVLTTGNKSELSVGYATLYGDMAGGFAVLKDVPKTLVYALARHRNAKHPVIPEGVFLRPPTAELRPGQTDQEKLPPYEVLDPILELYVERDTPPEDIVRAGFDPEIVARVVRMVDRSEYKRRQAPPGVKITPKAFGRDRRLPITSWYQPWTQLEAAAGTARDVR
ncbi:MAG: NAD+ synthase [Armatimonadota bacterium]|nr:NAD+ synthase [Armatimonadota bacterium]MDR7439954.1 NAD+ synthase [Armatimonadota bacterium]MDR7562381.1 NAD+ synthase [Armatimonadota bacterium]MDR7567072.1 NAD+ synthase [Armatimonadota bacterium]MDR7601537.1 NAD+ synthase [Armatimonadota bacterium]